MANAEGWLTYRHDNARSSVTGEKVATPLSLRWIFKPTHAPKPAWPRPAEELPRMHLDSAYHVTVANGTVYFGSSVDNKIYALNAKTGKVRWTFFTEGPIRFAPTRWKKKVYVGSDDGYVYCLRAKDGKPVWKYRAGPSDERVIGNGRMVSLWPVRTSVLVADGVVYFGAGVFPYEGIYICALNADDGKVIWKNDTIGDRTHKLAYDGISPQSYLVASDNVLYVPSGRAMPAAFDRKTGQFLYYCSGSKVGGTWALVDKGVLIAGVDKSGSPVKIAYDERTGKRKGDVYAAFPGIDLVVTVNVSYVLTEGGIHAIERAAHSLINEKLNTIKADKRKLTGRLSDLGQKLVESEANMREEVNKQIEDTTRRINELTKEEEENLQVTTCKWQYFQENLCTLVLAGDAVSGAKPRKRSTVVFAGGEGMVIAVSAQTGKKLWSSEVEGKAYGLAVSSGSLFVSTDKGHIYCFGKGTSSPGLSSGATLSRHIDHSPYPEDKLTPIYEDAAESIVKETGLKHGYCLVLDCGVGRLAFELAKRTELKIVGIEEDEKKVEIAKKSLDAAGLYGSRVVVERWELSSLPDYFANLIISNGTMVPRKAKPWSEEIYRVLRPCGGVAYIPYTSSWVSEEPGGRTQESSIKHLSMFIRGKLEGAGSWTHLYANPQNTACSDDRLVKYPLGVLWFGEPGPEGMVERHARMPSSLSIDGRLFIPGEEAIMAYDAYNGTFLWKKDIPGSVRARADVDGGNIAVTNDGLYVAARDKCYRLNPATGETVRVYKIPAGASKDANLYDGSPHRWGYVACDDNSFWAGVHRRPKQNNILFGSTTTPLMMEYAAPWKILVNDGKWRSLDWIPLKWTVYEKYIKSYMSRYPTPDENAKAAFHREGLLWAAMTVFPLWGGEISPKSALTDFMMVSDSIFAMDTETGKTLWVYPGDRIAHITATIGDGTIYFAESSVTEAQKEKALKDKQDLVERGIYKESDEANLKSEGERLSLSPDIDVRLVIALDAATGNKRWEKPLDVTGCGGDKVGTAYHNGILLFFGHFSNHDRSAFRRGSLKWRRITALSAQTGEVLWSRPLNYRRRPLIAGDSIIIEPRACDIRTGEIKMRSHPVTGERVPWEFIRPGSSCGVTSATPDSLFYRSRSIAMVDLLEDRGLSIFGAIRPGCWLELIAANGLLLFPEASSGCTCSFPLRCSVAMTHKKTKATKRWSRFTMHGAMTPAESLAINLGAPGDMKDDKGTFWFGYPRPKTSYGVKFKLNEKGIKQMGYFCRDFKGAHVEPAAGWLDSPWLFTSGYLGLLQCEVPLINDLWEEAGVYTVRLGFAALSGDQIGQRVFDVKLQGDVVLEDFDILKAAGSPNKALIKEFNGIKVENNLMVELVPKTPHRGQETNTTQAPMLNFIEAIREDVGKITESPETIKPLKGSDAENLLKSAKAELNKKNYETALEIYHTVFDGTDSAEFKLQALKGMADIGSPKSLSRIAKYYKDTSPILWDYRLPSPELIASAGKVYAAIANNMTKVDEQRAIKMLNHALAIASGLDTHQQLVDSLENLGVEVGADAAKAGFITRWYLIGPFPWDSEENTLDKVFVNEPNVDMNTSYQTGAKVLKWSKYVSEQGMCNLEKLFDPHTYVSAYAYAEVIFPAERELLLKIGSDDGFKCWFNGEVVGRYDGSRTWKADEDILKVKAQKGRNTVLLKISQGSSKWAFSVKLTDVNGKPVTILFEQ